MSRSSNQRRGQHARKPRGNNEQSGQPAASHGKTPSGSVVQRLSAGAHGNDVSKPRILEIRRPRRPKQPGPPDAASNAFTAADKAGTADTNPGSQQLRAPS